MASAWKDGADERIGKIISEELDERAPFLTGWVLVATFSDDEGDLCTAFNAMDGTRRTQSLGMLTHALEVEKARIFWAEKDDEG